jgi:hypothetical protein
MDRLTDSDDSAMQRRRGIGKSVRHEILLQLRKPAARRSANRLCQLTFARVRLFRAEDRNYQ